MHRFILCIVCLLTLNQYVNAQQLKFDHFAVAEGLSHSIITCVLQDSQGFLWFCSEDGLNKYDGYDFTIYRANEDDENSLSSSFIADIAEDQHGVLWIATNYGLNRFDPKTESFTQYFHNPQNPNSLSSNNIVNVFVDKRGDLWISTDSEGLNYFDLQTGQFTRYKHEVGNPNSLSGNNFKGTNHIFEDSRGYLWFGTWGQGLNRFDRQNNTFKLYTSASHKLISNSIYAIHETKNNPDQFWIATVYGLDLLDDVTEQVSNHISDEVTVIDLIEEDDGKLLAVCDTTGYGFTIYDPKTRNIETYSIDEADPYSIKGYPMAILKDHQGNIWIPSWGGGVNKLSKPNAFQHYYHTFGEGHLSNNTIYSFYETADGMIWVGTEGGGMCRFDPHATHKTPAFQCYRHDENQPDSSLINDDVYAISGDSNGRLWIATWEGFSRFDPKTQSFTNFRHEDNNPNSLINNHLYSLHVDQKDRIWAGTWEEGLSMYNQKTQQFTHYTHDAQNKNSLVNNQIMYIYSDYKDMIWLATPSGLNRFDPETETFTQYQHDKHDKTSISGNSITAIFEDRQQRLWVGTSGSGLNLFDRETEHFVSFTVKSHQLSGNTINGITQDKQGRLWIATNHGLSCFTPDLVLNKDVSCYDPVYDFRERKPVRNYDMGDGLQADEFFLGAALTSQTGELYMGGPGGFNRFDPEQISTNFKVPVVVFTDFKLFNESVSIHENSLLTQSINYLPQITLTHEDNIFSIHFSALDFVIPHKNQYAYQLVGFDKDWVYLDSDQRFSTYTNLPAGQYEFKVKASNNDGIWNDTGKSISINVLPPWWKTWWAYSLYFLIVAWFFIDQQRKLKKSQAYNQKLQEIDKLQEQAIRESQANERRLRHFLDAIPLGIAVLNPNGSMHYLNPSALNILGIKKYKTHNKHNISETYQFYIADTNTLYPNECLTSVRALNGETNVVNNIELHRHDGAVVPLESYGTPIFDEQQQVKYAIVTFQDIHERKQAEEDRLHLVQEQEAKNVALRYSEEIKLKNAELIRLNQEKNEFLGIAAHDLQNPLAAIRGTAEYIQEEFEDLSNEEILESAHMIEIGSRKMFDLISNLLDVNAIESGKVNMSLEKIDLLPIVKVVIQDYTMRANNKRIQIHFTSNKNHQLILVDKGIVQQILDNLVSNAVKYSPMQSNLYIRLYETHQEKVRFEVKDEGLGLSQEDLQKLFGKFVRLTPRPTGGEHSTGLGLFIVKKLVDAVEGQVWCESELGKGATFFLEFKKA